MNEELKRLLAEFASDDEAHLRIRVAFAIACIERAERILTRQDVKQALEAGRAWLRGDVRRNALEAAASDAAELARSHPGAHTLDGSGSGAVTLSHAVAFALAGRALDAAEYAAYAKIYAYANYAVTDPAAFREEHAWQVAKLKEIAGLEQPETAMAGGKNP